MPEYQSRQAAARSAPAEAVEQSGRLLRQVLSAGLRPSRVPVGGLGGLVQAKAAVGAPGDRWEREADRVADAVVGRLRAGPARRAAENGPGSQGGADAGALIARGTGRDGALGGDVRAAMEAGFGADLSGVRIHRDAAAHRLSRKLNAKAFTRGRDVFLSAGAPDLASAAGQRLLAHELTHVLQQGAAGQATGGAPLIQRQRDLVAGDTVAFSEDGDEYWGTISVRRTAAVGRLKYRLIDRTGDIHAVYAEDVVPVGLAEPLEEGEIIPDGNQVRANVELDVLDCVVAGSRVEPPEQFYTINVEWYRGEQLAQAYQMELPELRVRAKVIDAPVVKRLGKAKITHFHPQGQPGLNAAEYVRPGGPIDITRHALGSGVYGIAQPDAGIHNAAARDGAYQTAEVEINNPLVVQDAGHSGALQDLGKKINGMAQALHEERLASSPGKVDFQSMIADTVGRNATVLKGLLDRVFGRAGLPIPPLMLIQDALTRFFARYDQPAGKFVDQPTTIFLAELCGFGGIYGDAASGLNVFDMGSVAFIPPNQGILRKTRVGATHDFVL